MVSEARSIIEEESTEDKVSEAQVRRYVKACGLLTVELGREPIEEEVLKRVERLKRENHEYLQQKSQAKFSRTTGYGTDSGAASSTDGARQGHQYGTRAGGEYAGDDSREAWENQGGRGSWWQWWRPWRW